MVIARTRCAPASEMDNWKWLNLRHWTTVRGESHATNSQYKALGPLNPIQQTQGGRAL
jgi:hypothetical protein